MSSQPPLLFELNETPPPAAALWAALQHLLAVFGGIITAPLIIALGLGLSVAETSYLVTSALVISGVATAIQIARFGPVGSGMLSIQGTSFTFIGPILFAWSVLPSELSTDQKLGAILGTCAVSALIMMLLASQLERIRRVITHTVAGATVMLLGSALVWTTLNNLLSTASAQSSLTGSVWVLCQAAVVLVVTLFLATRNNPWVRLASIVLGLLAGYVLAFFLGFVDVSPLSELAPVFVPKPLHYPLSFDWHVFVVLMPIFVVSATESIGDLTATAALSGLPTQGREYCKRVRGGVIGDALNTLIAAVFGTFPNTTFSQNNGVIRLTGIASRTVGYYLAGLLVLLGLFPIVGGLFQVMPGGVLYGSTLLMFTLVTLAGYRILTHELPQTREWTIAGVAVVGGWLISKLIGQVQGIPELLKILLQFPVSTGAFIAIVLELVLPHPKAPDTRVTTAH